MMLKGKVALVTGGTSGLGLAIAERYLEEGAKVVIAGTKKKKCELVLRHLEKIAGKGSVRYVYGDVSKAADAKQLVDGTVRMFKRIDILVNSAGIFLERRAEDTTEEEWDRVIDIDLKGVWLCSKYAYPYFKKQKKGHIINLSSDAGIVGDPDCVAYCAAKGGVSNLTRAMAIDYAKENIRVNAICPAVIDTPMNDNEIFNADDPNGMIAFELDDHPVGRIGRPEEVAFIALMLASDESEFVTGACVMVDGGRTAR
jgi:NAD(P)-dependent dehydrogenase (short-subunit alcohol dehydrogenase family)